MAPACKGDPMDDSTRDVWTLPVRSQEIEEGPHLRTEADGAILEYGVRSETGELLWESMTFTRVAAYAFIDFQDCSEEHAAAYDKLLEIRPSPWLESLNRIGPDVKHYRIFFDDFGCYEIAAANFVPPL